jgi:hypothetical protein
MHLVLGFGLMPMLLFVPISVPVISLAMASTV